MSDVWATEPLEQISTNLTEFELQQNASNNGESCRLWGLSDSQVALSAHQGSPAALRQKRALGVQQGRVCLFTPEGLPSSAAVPPSHTCPHTACQY